MSCLPDGALSHFEQREQELLALNQQLEDKKVSVLAEASAAARDAESSALNARARTPCEDPMSPAPAPVAAASFPLGCLERPAQTPQACAAERILAAAASQGRPSSASCGDSLEDMHTTIRFQSARIAALQQDVDEAMQRLRDRDAELYQAQQESKKAQDESRRLQKANASSDQALEKVRRDLAASESRAQDLEREKADLLRDRNQIDAQQRKSDSECGSREARLNRVTEECEKYKAALKEALGQDKDRAAADRRETDRLTAEVKKLERQRTELVGAFKKQMKLIEVLKRQRAHVEAARVLSFTEDEFIRILELGDRLGGGE